MYDEGRIHVEHQHVRDSKTEMLYKGHFNRTLIE